MQQMLIRTSSAHSCTLHQHLPDSHLPRACMCCCLAMRCNAQGAAGGSNQHNHVVKFYRNGIFTVDDGAPRHMDDPANLDFINSVSRGECPRELDPGNSSVDVTVNMLRAEEDYVMPK